MLHSLSSYLFALNAISLYHRFYLSSHAIGKQVANNEYNNDIIDSNYFYREAEKERREGGREREKYSLSYRSQSDVSSSNKLIVDRS